MQQVDQVAQLERLLGMVRTNTRDDAPGLSHAPVDEYFDKARYDKEVELLFRRYPVVVAFSGQLRKPGHFVTHNDSGQPILVTRGTDGVLRAFLNVCRHRSAAVETKACGEGKRAFVCPYHGWAYDLTGRLLGITDGAAFGDVDRAAHGLRSLAVAEKYGLVWVVPTALEAGENAVLDIDAYLGPVSGELANWDMTGWEVHRSFPTRSRLNWKLMVDTFLEQYHFRYAHAGSVYPMFLDNIVTFERMDRHMRAIAAKRSLTEVEKQPQESWRILDHTLVLYQLFPNTVLIYGKDHCNVFCTFPISAEESVLHVSMLFDPQEPGPENWQDRSFGMLQKALGEDFAIAEGVQRNFHSGANERQTFGKFEKALGWYHNEIDRALIAERQAS
ncbi:MAG TPA: aromatic ring-hydroxylating dioxygenase subunit alpha [Reyranella sp.]|jgi:phenylpropionate dioxygenase-like ring-hydroxylating dioxygenase large terminal subunit